MTDSHVYALIATAAIVIGALLAVIALLTLRLRRLESVRKKAVAELDDASAAYAHANQRLARANEGLEAFVRSASHDLKAPIRHIYGFCGFVRESAADRLTDKEMKDLQRVMDAASHLSKLLDSLLRFAKLGATSLRHETFSLTDVVDVVVAQLPSDLQSSVSYRNLSTVTGDRVLLTLVMQNLIENGLKYVDTRPPRVVVASESTPTETRVSVIDNGIGVDQEKQDRIFEPGVRGVADSEIEGTGFGLAACAQIIHAHQGKIWVESNHSKGSTFHFTIPAAQPRNSFGA